MAKRNLNPDQPMKFLTIDEILKLTNKSRASIYRWCRSGTFPSPFKLGNGSIAWSVDEYNQWANSLKKVNY
ncbi:MAG: AlpA family phage regulatory protein [Thiotrichaceae bacterium]|nr:AlpA family phage regulatory protein [Thiotrichaceae bacterium]